MKEIKFLDKKSILNLITLISIIFIGTLTYAFADNIENGTKDAVYLGVENYGNLKKNDDLSSLKEFIHEFFIEGKKVRLKIDNKEQYNRFTIENKLQEGYIYKLTIKDGFVKDAILEDENSDDMVVGEIRNIGNNIIEVGNKKLKINENTKYYKINWIAGGSTVEEATKENITSKTAKIIVDDNVAKEVYITFVNKGYKSPVINNPGTKTLKNFLKTSLEPCGTVLYIYGGSWNWQDEASSNQSRSIGIAKSWIDFFDYQNENYSYSLKDENPTKDYYPHGSWNQYYYAGIDCSGYVGWAVYNTLNTTDGEEGYVMSATKMAKNFANRGWGTWTQDYIIPKNNKESDFKVGDIFSMNGHVWITVGICDDGSIVILHSMPSNSKTGKPGGGIQLSALGYNKECEAYKLAGYYMKKYYPKWTERYETVLKNIEDYTTIKRETDAGKFSWDLNNGILRDPDGYSKMNAGEILKDIFGTSLEENMGSSDGHTFIKGKNKGVKDKGTTNHKFVFTIDKNEYEEIKDGVKIIHKMDVSPVIKNDRTMLPLRYVAEVIGAKVNWNHERRTAKFIKDGLEASIQIDNNKIILSNGKTIKMDAKPLNIKSRILVSLVNVSNVFGLTNGDIKDNTSQDIEWDGQNRTVTIFVK